METNRIKIIDQDQSTSTAATETSYRGFTVVAAPKGPIEPVYIAAGKPNLIYEILGYTSTDYPSIQEVIDFNNSYGLYVSAPYATSGANVAPVAYVTPAGIFAAQEAVDVSGYAIETIDGDEESSPVIEGITSFSQDPNILVPITKSASTFGSKSYDSTGTAYTNSVISDIASPLTYNTASVALNIDVGFNFATESAVAGNSSALQFLHNGVVGGGYKVMAAPVTFTGDKKARLAFDIEGVSDVLLLDVVCTGSAGQYTISLVTTDTSSAEVGKIVGQTVSGATTLAITGSNELSGLYATYFSTSAISTWWASPTNRKKVNVYWVAALHTDAIYASIFQKYLSSRDTKITFSKQALGNKISFTATEIATPSTSTTRTISGSLDESEVDGFGAELGFSNKLANQYLLNIYVLKTFGDSTVYTQTRVASAPTITMAPIYLRRGVRNLVVADDSSTESVDESSTLADTLEQGWTKALDPLYDNVQIFFATNDLSVDNASSAFFSIPTSHQLSMCVFNKDINPTNITEAISTLAYGQNFVVTTNKFSRQSIYTKDYFWTPLVGLYCAMLMRIKENRFGGVAPMFLNNSDMGGQLGVSVRKSKYSYTADQKDLLDDANYNPIVKDPSYGVMVEGQKTAKGGDLSDWSYVGHASSFLECQRDIRDNVMIPQLGKANNPYFRELRQQQTQSIINRRVAGNDRIWAAAVAATDTTNVNTDEVRNARHFALAVTVKVDVFSEGVILTFTNVDQSVEL